MVVTLLAGGTGGAKLAVGLRDILHGHDGNPPSHPGQLNVVANTADDIEIYDVHVSPDPDLISFRLAGVLDDRGFGISGESHDQMDRRRADGEEIWFELGDDDIAVCTARAHELQRGRSQTEAHEMAMRKYPAGGAAVLPMSDDRIRTVVQTSAGPRGIQEFLIRDRCEPEILGVEFAGAEAARASDHVLAAIGDADQILIGPSNPAISVGPILATPGVREAIADSDAPVVGVSPFVAGEVLKGPTAKFLSSAGYDPSPTGAAEFYGEIVDGWVADEPVEGFAHHLYSVELSSDAAARDVAAEILRYGDSLR